MNAPQRVEMLDRVDTASIDLELKPMHAPVVVDASPETARSASAAPATSMQMLEAFLQRPDIDLDRAERFLAILADMRAEQAKLRFREDFAKFTALGLVIPKTKFVNQKGKNDKPGPRYWQTEFEHVTGILKPALGQCGFGVRFNTTFERGDGGPWCSVTCTLEHSAGHTEAVTLGGPPDDSGAKNPLQEMQSSATFLMRHSLLAITGTAQAGNDNDGRGQRGADEDDEPAAQQQASLLQQGRDESLKGLAALNAWWGKLKPRERTELQSEFAALRRGAVAADQAGSKP